MIARPEVRLSVMSYKNNQGLTHVHHNSYPISDNISYALDKETVDKRDRYRETAADIV